MKNMSVAGPEFTMTSREVARVVGKRHDNVLREIDNLLKTLSSNLRTGFSESYVGDTENGYRIYNLDEDSALFLASRYDAEASMKVIKGLRERRQKVFGLAREAELYGLILEKRASHRPMMDALVEHREDQGKKTLQRHFMNENLLCNWCVTGKFMAIKEEDLTAEGLELLKRVRRHNESLIMVGFEYKARRPLLLEYSNKQRLKLLGNMLKPAILLSSDVSDV
jgi:hypothetical protein